MHSNETERNRTLVSLLSIMPWERFYYGKLEDSDLWDFLITLNTCLSFDSAYLDTREARLAGWDEKIL